MSKFGKQIGVGVASAVLAAAVVGIFGYIFVVKENQFRISELERVIQKQSTTTSQDIAKLNEDLESHIEKISTGIERSRSTVDSLKLFVVAAHPDRSYISLTSSVKLQSLNPQQFEVLADGLNEYRSVGLKDLTQGEFSDEFEDLVREHDFTDSDLESYLNAMDGEVGSP